MMPGGRLDIVEMALMGLDTSLIAPAIVLLSRSWPGWKALTWPPVVALPLALVAHAAVTIWMALAMPTVMVEVGVHLALLALSFVFWLPLLRPGTRLSDAGRSLYLFLAMPSMDLAGVFVVLNGDSRGGLAMIVAMLPIGVMAVASTWRWITLEEAAVVGSQ
jgi:hypothetical protein